MTENPYQSPDCETVSERAKEVRGLTLVSATLGTVLPPVWVSALIFGWVSEGLIAFHAIFALLLLVPSVALLVFAFAGRDNSVALRRSIRIANAIGTLGFIAIGLCGCTIYAIAVYYRHMY